LRPNDGVEFCETKCVDYRTKFENTANPGRIDAVKYYGTYKLCNVKVFKDGKEFYRIDYKTNGTFYYEYFLQIRIRKKEDDSGVYVTGFNDMPTEIGEYVLRCEYNSYGYRHSLNYFSDNTFPAKYYLKSETVNLIIQE